MPGAAADKPKKMGRPPGSGPVARLRRQLLTKGRLTALVDAVYTRALAGDMAAARLLLDRAIPALRAQAAPVQLALPAGGSLTDHARALVAAAAAGELAPDIAAELVRAVGGVVAVEQGDELRKRLDALEAAEQAAAGREGDEP